MQSVYFTALVDWSNLKVSELCSFWVVSYHSVKWCKIFPSYTNNLQTDHIDITLTYYFRGQSGPESNDNEVESHHYKQFSFIPERHFFGRDPLQEI